MGGNGIVIRIDSLEFKSWSASGNGQLLIRVLILVSPHSHITPALTTSLKT